MQQPNDYGTLLIVLLFLGMAVILPKLIETYDDWRTRREVRAKVILASTRLLRFQRRMAEQDPPDFV